jgi:F0F1-type ATP synthase assembly protein I
MGELTTNKTAKQSSNAVLLLITTGLDATWRTLVPGIAGTILGIYLDHLWHTIPVMTITGLVLGIALSALLIHRLFKAVKS